MKKHFLLLIFIFVSVISGNIKTDGTSTDYKNKIEQWVRLWETYDTHLADNIFSKDFTCYIPSYSQITNFANYKKEILAAKKLTLSSKISIDDLIIENNKVVGRFTAKVKMKSQGLMYINTWIIIFHFEDGKIKKKWWHMDLNGVMQQLGMKPKTRNTFSWSENLVKSGSHVNPEISKSLNLKLINEFNKNNEASLNNIFTVNYILHDPVWNTQQSGIDSFTKWCRKIMRPLIYQSKFVIEDTITEKDKLAVRWRLNSKLQIKNNKTSITGIFIHRIYDNKVSETWVRYDLAGLDHQKKQ